MRISAQRSHGTVTSHHEVNKKSRPAFCSSHLLVCFVRPLIHVILLSIILVLAPSFRPPPARNPKVIPKWPGSLRLRRSSRSAPRRPLPQIIVLCLRCFTLLYPSACVAFALCRCILLHVSVYPFCMCMLKVAPCLRLLAAHRATMVKRKRESDVVSLHRNSYVSQRALATVLQRVRDEGMPSAFSRSTQARALEEHTDIVTPMGNVLQKIALPTGEDMIFQAPMPMLWATVRRCAPFRQLLANQLREHPPSIARPWQVIMYFDGITPKDPLAKGKDKKKLEAVYWSFLELGPWLWDERMWFEVSAARRVLVETLPGVMSQNIAFIMDSLFFSEGFSFSRHGCTLDLSDAGDSSSLVTLWAAHEATLADFLAHQEVLGANGPNATKPCPSCRNVLSHKTVYADRSGGAFVKLTSLTMGDWKAHTDTSLRVTHEGLRVAHTDHLAGRMSKKRFK